jgi:hypothetical protein
MTSVLKVRKHRPVNPHGRNRQVTYQRELIRCGSKRWNCQCKQPGGGHGPYWFAYWRHAGRKRKRYIGVELKLLTFEQLRATERHEARKKVREAKKSRST